MNTNNYKGYIIALKFGSIMVTVLNNLCIFKDLEPFYDVVSGIAAVNTEIIIFRVLSISIKFLVLQIIK